MLAMDDDSFVTFRRLVEPSLIARDDPSGRGEFGGSQGGSKEDGALDIVKWYSSENGMEVGVERIRRNENNRSGLPTRRQSNTECVRTSLGDINC